MRPKVVAEIGCNHQGSLKTAEEMIAVAATYCKVDIIKFQKRDTKGLPKEVRERPYLGPHSFGETYGEHRDKLEFDLETHKVLKEACEAYGTEYLCSVWDLKSAEEILSLKPTGIKIPSALNTDYDLLDYIKSNFFGHIHISLGMTTKEEREEIIRKAPDNAILYHCISAYPVEFNDTCLLELTKYRVNALSGHHKGIAVDIAAYVLGAQHIERHFTLDRMMKGTDHAASLEPEGMKKLVRDLKAVSKALSYNFQGLRDCEKGARNKLKPKPQS